MPRLYLTNDSYPELREIDAQWSRTRTWWRAIGHAIRHIDFWIFALTQLGLVIGIVLGGIGIAAVAGLDGASGRIVHLSFAIGALLVFCYLQISWGGDMMRRHLRAVSDVARYACPNAARASLVTWVATRPPYDARNVARYLRGKRSSRPTRSLTT